MHRAPVMDCERKTDYGKDLTQTLSENPLHILVVSIIPHAIRSYIVYSKRKRHPSHWTPTLSSLAVHRD